jgi:hypothetical protein
MHCTGIAKLCQFRGRYFTFFDSGRLLKLVFLFFNLICDEDPHLFDAGPDPVFLLSANSHSFDIYVSNDPDQDLGKNKSYLSKE